MTLIIPLCHFLARICIAILTQMWAGVILTYIFAHNAAAELALAFITVVTMGGVGVVGQDDGVGR